MRRRRRAWRVESLIDWHRAANTDCPEDTLELGKPVSWVRNGDALHITGRAGKYVRTHHQLSTHPAGRPDDPAAVQQLVTDHFPRSP